MEFTLCRRTVHSEQSIFQMTCPSGPVISAGPNITHSMPKRKKVIPKNDFSWWFQAESNRRHQDFQSFALPTELQNQWLRGKDLNQRPPGYGPDELPGCSTSRCDMREYGGGAGIRTLAPVSRPTGFQDRTLQPLGYSSIVDPEGLEPSTNRL